MKSSIKDFFSQCDQIRSFLRIWSHSLKKSLMKNLILSAVFYQVHLRAFNIHQAHLSQHKKLNFSLGTSSRDSCGFGHIYWKIRNGKLHFLCSLWLKNCDNYWWETWSWVHNIKIHSWNVTSTSDKVTLHPSLTNL